MFAAVDPVSELKPPSFYSDMVFNDGLAPVEPEMSQNQAEKKTSPKW